jgi:ribosomal protein S7
MGLNCLKSGTNLYKKLLGVLIKKGNLIQAKLILDKTFLIVFKKTGFSKQSILLKLFVSLNTFVEVKKVKLKRRFFLIPFSINLKRRSYLIIGWLIKAVKEDATKKPFAVKLSNEILNLIGGALTRSKKLKKLNTSQAISNRSNIHYRW